MFQDVQKVGLHLITRLYHVPVFCSQEDDNGGDDDDWGGDGGDDDDWGGDGGDDDDWGGDGGKKCSHISSQTETIVVM